MDLLLLVTFFVALISSVLSGMSGGGGGFVMTPFFLLIGMSPQQIAGNASVAGLGLGASSLLAMKGRGLIKKQLILPLAAVTILFTVLAMLVLPHIKSDSFEMVIGALLLVLAPTLFIKKSQFQPGPRGRASTTAGYIVYALILFASALGSGLATLLFLPLIFLMGLTTLEANALRRVLMIIQAVVAFLIILPQGFIVWSYALTTLIGCYIGGHVGTKFALKKGERFATHALAAVMILSGIILLLR